MFLRAQNANYEARTYDNRLNVLSFCRWSPPSTCLSSPDIQALHLDVGAFAGAGPLGDHGEEGNDDPDDAPRGEEAGLPCATTAEAGADHEGEGDEGDEGEENVEVQATLKGGGGDVSSCSPTIWTLEVR